MTEQRRKELWIKAHTAFEREWDSGQVEGETSETIRNKADAKAITIFAAALTESRKEGIEELYNAVMRNVSPEAAINGRFIRSEAERLKEQGGT